MLIFEGVSKNFYITINNFLLIELILKLMAVKLRGLIIFNYLIITI